MYYKRRELRRLWEIELFLGDPGVTDAGTRKATLIAWNAVDAIRHAGGRAVSPPVALFFVSWEEVEDGPIYRINNTREGPVGDPIKPTVYQEPLGEENWK